ncbi:hypothetical protein [Alteromonas sp. 14N.309.X.WAT.G.H12]|uniref:hypothetical protein n=1 Tax=Alteromonas sp. 14N.309.X.WAT.G.H12 TaxID=3120824 RepID=UPI002FD14528
MYPLIIKDEEWKVMAGHISSIELRTAIKIPDSLKARITEYERSTWAANVTLPQMSRLWKDFYGLLERAIKNDKLDDKILLTIICHLSTIDTVSVLTYIEKLSLPRQQRFIQLLNWVAEKSEDDEMRVNAKQVVERILTVYRSQVYPEVFSASRIERATQIISQTK